MAKKCKTLSTNIRVKDALAWKQFKIVAARHHLSANALINLVIEECAARGTPPGVPNAPHKPRREAASD